MKYIPMFFQVRDQPCLVVGGGSIAARKSELLLKGGARVRIVAPETCERVEQMAAQGDLEILRRKFEPADLEQVICVIASTDDDAVNAEVSRLAKARQLPVNVVDSPELCSFIVPSMMDRDPVTVAISTGGVSPVLARILRAKLEASIPGAYGQLGQLASEFRDRILHF